MSGPELITLGCRLNFSESEAMRAMAGDRNDLVIVNSCAVTTEAVRKTRQQIRKAKRARPDAEILVTGCAVQTEPETFSDMSEVSRLLGNREKMLPESFVSSQSLVSDIMAVRETAPHLVTGFAERARAFVEVQNGCDHRCTFCVIPYGRGNSRSVPAGLVVDRIKALVDEGFQEIVLTGVDVTSYGPDLPGSPSLGLLVERILTGAPELPRLRLSSLDSIEIDERLFDIITVEPRFMPHLHLSLQAGDDMILKRMKRRHTRAQSVEMVARFKAKRPEIAIGADIIAGFPTESESMAANTLALVDDCQIVFGHIFPYSARRGTPAARMPQVPVPDRKARAQRLRAASQRQKARFLKSLVGSRQRVLVEREDGFGHAENFAEVRLRGGSGAPGHPAAILDTRIAAVEEDILVGEIV